MLNLNLRDLARTEVRVQGEIAPDDGVWQDTGVTPLEPLAVDLTARAVGHGVLVQGTLAGRMEAECRRCLDRMELEVDEEVSLWFEPAGKDNAEEDGEGESYLLPERGAELDLGEPLREQILLRLPEYVLCRADCSGLCPRCGAKRSLGPCGCVEAPAASGWDALNKIKFD